MRPRGAKRSPPESMPTLLVYDNNSAIIVAVNSVYCSSYLFYNSFIKSTSPNKWNYLLLSTTLCFFLDRQPNYDSIGKNILIDR